MRTTYAALSLALAGLLAGCALGQRQNPVPMATPQAKLSGSQASVHMSGWRLLPSGYIVCDMIISAESEWQANGIASRVQYQLLDHPDEWLTASGCTFMPTPLQGPREIIPNDMTVSFSQGVRSEVLSLTADRCIVLQEAHVPVSCSGAAPTEVVLNERAVNEVLSSIGFR